MRVGSSQNTWDYMNQSHTMQNLFKGGTWVNFTNDGSAASGTLANTTWEYTNTSHTTGQFFAAGTTLWYHPDGSVYSW